MTAESFWDDRPATGSGTGSCSTKTADILCKYLMCELVPKREGRGNDKSKN